MSSSFGERLRTLRKKAGLTQPELAYLVGVHETTIRRWETNGKGTPSIDEISRLADALHSSEAELLNEDSEVQGWVLTVKIADDFREEVIDLTKEVPKISSISTSLKGAVICLGGSYEMWQDDANFKKLQSDIKKMRPIVLQNGIALGAIKPQK